MGGVNPRPGPLEDRNRSLDLLAGQPESQSVRVTQTLAAALEHGWVNENGFHPYKSGKALPPEAALLWSDAPRIWRRIA